MYDSIHCSRYLSGEKNEKARYRCCALVVGTVSASAADLAARPYTKAPVAVAAVYNWTGFYIGGQVGYAWGDNRTTEFVTATGLPSGFNQNYNTDGVVGGVHAGYNWQFGQFVFGLEGDVEGADIKGGYRLVNTNGNGLPAARSGLYPWPCSVLPSTTRCST